MANRVMHFEVQADDIERAKKFYEKVFDWKVEKWMSADDKGGEDYWGLMTGLDGTPGINGGMYKRGKEHPVYTYDCTITVEDIDKAVEAIKKDGGKIRTEKTEIPKVGWFANAIDTEGNMFSIMQPTEWKPK